MRYKDKYPLGVYAKMKNCSRQTVFNNLRLFEVRVEGRCKYIIMNDFAKEWQPDKAAQSLGKKRFPKTKPKRGKK